MSLSQTVVNSRANMTLQQQQLVKIKSDMALKERQAKALRAEAAELEAAAKVRADILGGDYDWDIPEDTAIVLQTCMRIWLAKQMAEDQRRMKDEAFAVALQRLQNAARVLRARQTVTALKRELNKAQVEACIQWADTHCGQQVARLQEAMGGYRAGMMRVVVNRALRKRYYAIETTDSDPYKYPAPYYGLRLAWFSDAECSQACGVVELNQVVCMRYEAIGNTAFVVELQEMSPSLGVTLYSCFRVESGLKLKQLHKVVCQLTRNDEMALQPQDIRTVGRRTLFCLPVPTSAPNKAPRRVTVRSISDLSAIVDLDQQEEAYRIQVADQMPMTPLSPDESGDESDEEEAYRVQVADQVPMTPLSPDESVGEGEGEGEVEEAAAAAPSKQHMSIAMTINPPPFDPDQPPPPPTNGPVAMPTPMAADLAGDDE